MTAFCHHPGCLAQLFPGNVSGVCKAHVHGPACRCATCRAPRKATGRRHSPRWHLKTRPEPEAEGLLLPGLSTIHLPIPTAKGKP